MPGRRGAGMLGVALWAALVVAAAGPAAAEVVVRGRALDVRSEPLRGALVEILHPERRYEQLRRVLEGAPPPAAVREARAGADGAFDVVAPGPGPWQVVVSAPGYLPQFFDLRPLPEEQVLPPAILQQASVEEVQLVATDGSAGTGAWVELERRTRPRTLERYALFTGWTSEPILGFADDAGRFFYVRGKNERLRFRVVLPDGTMRLAVGAGLEEPETLDAHLRPAATQRLRFELGGRPVAAAVVVVDGRPQAKTDARGTAEVSLARRSQVELLTPNGVHQAWTLRGFDQQAEGDRRLELTSPEQLLLRVVSADGRPVAGVTAVVEGRLVRGDEGGTLRFALRERGRRDVWIGARGFLPFEGALEAGDDIRLHASVSVDGLTVTHGDEPLAEVDLVVVPEAPNRRPFWVRSDSLGRVRLTGLRGNSGYTARPAWQKQALGENSFWVRGDRREPLRIRLRQPRQARGRVLGLRARPLSGARVTARAGRMQLPPVFADADGLFELRAAVGELELHVEAPDHAPGSFSVVVPRGTAAFEVGDLELERGVDLDVLVTDPEENPIADALVTLDMASAIDVGRGRARGGGDAAGARRSTAARTDGAGFARLLHLQRASGYRVRIVRRGFLDQTLEDVRVPRSGPLEVRLEQAAAIAGIVLGQDGRPVARAFVGLSSKQIGLPEIADPYTEADGTFLLTGLRAGRYEIWARAEGQPVIDPVEIEVAPGETREGLELQAPAGIVVRGWLSDVEGAPLEGEPVVIDSQYATTRTDGSFEVQNVRPGRRRSRACRDSRRVHGEVEAQVAMAPLELVCQRERAGTLRGRVVDIDGQPVAGAEILRFSGAPALARTDDAGRFEAGALRGSVRLLAHEPSRRLRGSVGPIDGETEDEIEIVVRAHAAVRGRVAGLPPSGRAWVVFERAADPGSDRARIAAAGERRASSGLEGDGSYSLEVRPGAWVVTVHHTAGTQPSAPVRLAMQEIEVREGDDLVLDLEAEQPPERAKVAGTVTLDGAPAEGLWLQLRGEGAGGNWAKVDAAGRFEMNGVPRGSYVVWAAETDSSVLLPVVMVSAPSREIELHLRRFDVTGQVRDKASLDLVPARAVLHAFGLEAPLRVGDDGSFRVRAVGSGALELEVSAPGYFPQHLPISARGHLDFLLEGSG